METHFSRGKLIIAGEYAVLYGVEALAVPLKFGQRMSVDSAKVRKRVGQIHWRSLDSNGKCWFEGTFENNYFTVLDSTDFRTAFALQRYLMSANSLNPAAIEKVRDYEVETVTEFDRNWGFGSSSTLTANISSWLRVDPFKLNSAVSRGSGIDVAVATRGMALLYRKTDEGQEIVETEFNPSFRDQIYFVYLGNKQNSEREISRMDKHAMPDKARIARLEKQVHLVANAKSAFEFCMAVELYEGEVSEWLGIKTAKDRLFRDFQGTVKSLGAWGGDFVMLITAKDPKEYLKQKGLGPVFTFDELIFI